MSTFAKAGLSGVAAGNLALQITPTATAGTTVHTAVSGTGTEWDEVWLQASNISGSDVVLTLEFGGTGVANELDFIVPANSTVPILTGHPLQNAAVLAAYAATANVINLFGYVNTIRD